MADHMEQESIHVFVTRLCSLLDQFRWLLDSYVIVCHLQWHLFSSFLTLPLSLTTYRCLSVKEFFTEEHWRKFPPIWQESLELVRLSGMCQQLLQVHTSTSREQSTIQHGEAR